MLDAIVIGGGPAGAASALLLARAGRSVAVLEKAKFPRAKVCGEFIAGPAVRALRALGLGAALDEAPEIRRIALWARDACFEAPLSEPYARALDRETLDTLLLRAAARGGARVHQPALAIAARRTDHGVFQVMASNHLQLESKICIAAHGSWDAGRLPTQCRNTKAKASDLFGFKAHFRGHAVAPRLIALAPFPGGYGGAMALGDGRATFACCVRRDALAALRSPGVSAGEAVFATALASSRPLRAALGGARREGAWLGAGPLRPAARPLLVDGILAVGNTAGEVHPIVGEGIALALDSASALARTLQEPHASLEAVVHSYSLKRNFRFRRKLLSSSCFAAAALHPGLGACARAALGTSPALLSLLARA